MNFYSEYDYVGQKSYKGLGDIKRLIKKAIRRMLGLDRGVADPEKLEDAILSLTQLQISFQDFYPFLTKSGMKKFRKRLKDKKELTSKEVEDFTSSVNIHLDSILNIMNESNTRISKQFPELHNAIYGQAVMLVSDLKSILSVIAEGANVPNSPDDPNNFIQTIDLIREYRDQMYDLQDKELPPEEKRAVRKRRKEVLAFLLANVETKRSELMVHLDDAVKHSDELSEFMKAATNVVEAERMALARTKSFFRRW